MAGQKLFYPKVGLLCVLFPDKKLSLPEIKRELFDRGYDISKVVISQQIKNINTLAASNEIKIIEREWHHRVPGKKSLGDYYVYFLSHSARLQYMKVPESQKNLFKPLNRRRCTSAQIGLYLSGVISEIASKKV